MTSLTATHIPGAAKDPRDHPAHQEPWEISAKLVASEVLVAREAEVKYGSRQASYFGAILP